MTEILNHPQIQELLTNLASNDLNLTTEFAWLIIATVLSMVGGAIGGIFLAGKELGYELSGTLGALFGPSGVIPALLLSFAVLNLLGNY